MNGDTVDALDDLRRIVTTMPRQRSPREPPAAITDAYLNLILGYGYARAGRADRARQLADDARVTLAAGDRVHRYLTAAFGARIEQAITGARPEAPLPESLIAELLELDRVTRYKVDRLREQSRILAPLERIDAIDTWVRQVRAEVDELLRVGIEARPEAIDDTLATAERNADLRVALLHRVLDALPTIEHATIDELLRATVTVVARVGVHDRPLLYARALAVADFASHGALVSECADWLRHTAEHADVTALELALPRLCTPLHRRELAELVIAAHASTDLRASLALAGSFAFLGDHASAESLLARGKAALAKPLMLQQRLELVGALARAHAQVPGTYPAILELAGGLRHITDDFGTNSHFVISVLGFVEVLVLALVGTIAGAERGLHRRGDE